MSTLTVPAIRGAIGRTDYFMAKVPARQLGAIVVPASEMPEWKNWGFSERFQRIVSIARIRQELGPYLVRSKDRFYGSLIVTVMEPEVFEFESLNDFAADLPAATRKNMASMGQLSIHGGKLVALDGQHRLVALREIVAGRLEVGGANADTVGDDDVCVMFIQHESLERTRRIFNKVNRHARPTTPNDNIITSEDDGYAIVTRWLMENDPPLGLDGPKPPLAVFDDAGELLVEWEKQTPTGSDGKLTTLNAVYKTVQAILAAHGVRDFDEKSRVNRPDNDELEQAYKWAAEWWTTVLKEVNGLRIARNNPHLIKSMWPWRKARSLLLRPLGLVGLFRGLAHAVQAGLSLDEAVERANKLPWSASDVLWRNVIIGVNGRVLKNEKNVNLMARLVCYMIAPQLVDSDFRERLALTLAEARGELEHLDGDSPEGYLPPPVV